MAENLPLHADVTQSQDIANMVMDRLDLLIRAANKHHDDLDPAIVLQEVMLATRRWLATHDTYRCGHGDLVDQDTHVLQTLFAEIALELTARGMAVTYAVGAPEPVDEFDGVAFALGTGVMGVVKP